LPAPGARAKAIDKSVGVSVVSAVASAWRGIGSNALFAYGFRPFFLVAGLYGALAVPLWLGAYTGWVHLEPALPPALWHGHEMLFGYGTAVLAGFLLTATPSWSGIAPVRGAALAGLLSLWLAGRLGLALGEQAAGLAAAIDLAFLPALMVAISPALQSAARHNLVFLPLLAGLTLANLATHLDAIGLIDGIGSPALLAALDLFVLMIGLIGGRIVPAFTANALMALGQPVPVRRPVLLDRLAIASLVAVLLADLSGMALVAGMAALLAALLNGLRMAGWATARILRQPIVWVLHLGYAWLVAGLAWKGLVTLLAFAPASEGLHGLAVGAIGTMTLAVMSRAALGHTGRPLRASAWIVASYVLVSAAAVARLAALLLPAGLYLPALLASGLLWAAAFAIFSGIYAPVLIHPRVDGKPG
jgi:uncharacterized protein involved in response to NO